MGNNNNDNNKNNNNNNKNDNNKNDNKNDDDGNNNKNNDKDNDKNDDNNNDGKNNNNAYYEGNYANVAGKGYYEEVNGYTVENFDGYEITTVNPGLSLLFYTAGICLLAYVMLGIITWRYKFSISGTLQNHMSHLGNTIFSGKEKGEKEEESISIKNGDIELSRTSAADSRGKGVVKPLERKVHSSQSGERKMTVVSRIGKGGKKVYSLVPTMIEYGQSKSNQTRGKRLKHHVGLRKPHSQERASSAPDKTMSPVRPFLYAETSDISIDTAPTSSRPVWFSLFGESASVLSEPIIPTVTHRLDSGQSSTSTSSYDCGSNDRTKSPNESNASNSTPEPQDNESKHHSTRSDEFLSFSDFSPSNLFQALIGMHSSNVGSDSSVTKSNGSITPITRSKKKELSEGLMKDEVETNGNNDSEGNSVERDGYSTGYSTEEFNLNSEFKKIFNLAGP
jgi:hypothetical protein